MRLMINNAKLTLKIEQLENYTQIKDRTTWKLMNISKQLHDEHKQHSTHNQIDTQSLNHNNLLLASRELGHVEKNAKSECNNHVCRTEKRQNK